MTTFLAIVIGDETIAYVLGILASILSVVGSAFLVWFFRGVYREVQAIRRLADYESNHNGGNSMKDHTKRFADGVDKMATSVERLETLQEANLEATNKLLVNLGERPVVVTGRRAS